MVEDIRWSDNGSNNNQLSGLYYISVLDLSCGIIVMGWTWSSNTIK